LVIGQPVDWPSVGNWAAPWAPWGGEIDCAVAQLLLGPAACPP